jgi:hypothetical protein
VSDRKRHPAEIVRDREGGKDRVTMVPETLVDDLARQLATVRRQHERDVAAGAASTRAPVRQRSARTGDRLEKAKEDWTLRGA